MRILIVEDEIKTGDYLRKGLIEAGFQASLARTGPDGLDLALHEDYALIVLDVMLPGIDGWSVLRQLRDRKQTPVLMLTARDEVADRVRGLELGADDYLIKPFAFAELLARLRTLLRRAPPRARDTLNVADLCIEVQRRRVSRNAVRIDLTVQDFALLQLLAEREGDVLSRSLIASHVWDMNYESDTNVVDVAIRRLRAKIDDPYPVKLVHTVRGMGYVLEVRA